LSSAGRDFDVVYRDNLRRLVAQAYLVTGDVEEARDCVQEAFARAWVRWDRLSVEVDDPVAWLSTVTYRIAISGWRRRQAAKGALRRLGRPQPCPPPSVEAVLVATALARLPPGQRAVVVLHYYEGQRVEDIARTLSLSVSAVKSRLLRARTALGPLVDGKES
jgi:RNA polymerase sigma-70 factor (ECF subfamily)